MDEKLLKKYEKEKDYNALITLINKLILKNPQDKTLLYRKSKALMNLGKYNQAITTLEIYLKHCDENDKFEAYLALFRCYSMLNDDEMVEESLANALKYDCENELILKHLSYTSYINHNHAKCIEYIKKLIEINKADIEDYTNLIFCCIQLDMIEEALMYCEKIREIDPTNLDIFAVLTIVYENIEDDSKLKEVCQEIVNLEDDGTLQIILLKAQAYLELGQKKNAFDFADKAIKLNPYDPFPYLMKGMLYSKLEKDDEAQECFSEAIKLNPDIFNTFIEYIKNNDAAK